MSLNDWYEKAKSQCSFEKTIKDIVHKEPPRDLPRANIRIIIKANHIRNFNLDTKNQFTRTTKPIDFIGSTIVIRITRIIGSFSMLEDITQQLLDNKHTFTLGQLFKIILNLKQYVIVRLGLEKKKPLQ